jgi:ABC-type nickel/cobalt efflux system permease component RcnA
VIRVRFIGTVLIVFMLINIHLEAQVNPMFSHSKSDTSKFENKHFNREKNTTSHSKPSFISQELHKFLRKNSRWQMQLRRTITQKARSIKSEGNSSAYLWILLISFVYGIAHSLGPGHNKVLVFSYFMGENAKVKQGLKLGVFTAFIHALSGLIVSLVILYVIKESTTAKFDESNAALYITKFSFAFISVIGFVLLIEHIYKFRKRNEVQTTILSEKRIIPMALGLGIVPCPGTMILVSFLSIAGLQFFAPFAALAMALGMAFIISLIGIITLASKDLILRLFNGKSDLLNVIQFVLAIIGSLLIIVVGLVFLFF